MKATKEFLLSILLLCTCFFVLILVGCEQKPSPKSSHVHTIVKNEGKEATCLEEGWKPYNTCAECDEYTTYERIAPLGHDYGTDYQPDGEVHNLTCSRCDDVVSKAHDWRSGAYTKPTCTENGSQVYNCYICKAEKTEIIPLLGHDYSENFTPDGDVHSITCHRCDVTMASHPHDWSVFRVTTQPSCTTSGTSELICVICIAKTTVETDPIGHSFESQYKPNGDVHSYYCTRCPETTADNPHNWVAANVEIEPTCTNTGTQNMICSVCSAVTVSEISALGHRFDSEYTSDGDVHSLHCIRCSITTSEHPHVWVKEGTVNAPTCTDSGTDSYRCSVCAEVKTESVSPLGHSFGSEFIPNGDVHSLCCVRCSATTSSHPHAEGESVVIEPAGAFTSGVKQINCGICGADMGTGVIPPDVELMPIIYLVGDYESAHDASTNKKVEVPMTARYVTPDGETIEFYATIKAQGSSSLAYAKKNYTIKFYKDSEYETKLKINFGWGKESKYVMKANWVDFSQARNVVSCRLWGDLVASRNISETQQRLAALKTNGGAIDGFPISVYMNGTFHGLYTMNVPKDEWMFDMGDSETEALIAADDWNSTDFYSYIESFVEDSNGDLMAKKGGWELRYYGTEDTTGSHQWVADSFDALIKFCQENDGDSFRNGISQYLDIDAAIDYVIFMYANCMHDNASKNMLWATYDGKVWIPSVYDQDGTFGQVWDGVRFEGAANYLPIVKNGRIDVNIGYGPNTGHIPKFILWDKILNYFTEEILERYWELRLGALSTEHIISELRAFEEVIPETLFAADAKRWEKEREKWWISKGKTGTWDYEPYHYDYMYQWVEERMMYYDAAMLEIENFYYNK